MNSKGAAGFGFPWPAIGDRLRVVVWEWFFQESPACLRRGNHKGCPYMELAKLSAHSRKQIQQIGPVLLQRVGVVQ